MTAKGRKSYDSKTLDYKRSIIIELENESPASVIAKREGLALSTVCTWLKNKDKILHDADKAGGRSNKMKRIKRLPTTRQSVDEALHTWYSQLRSSNVAINGPLLLTKANRFAQDFQAEPVNKSWIDRWKVRYGIENQRRRRSRRIVAVSSGSSVALGLEAVHDWKTTELKSILEQHAEKDIYNMDETATEPSQPTCKPDQPSEPAKAKEKRADAYQVKDEGISVATLIVEEKHLYIGKDLLVVCSPVFRSMLGKDNDGFILDLKGKKFEHVVWMLDYLSPDIPFTVTGSMASPLVELAVEFNITNLIPICTELLSHQPSLEVVAQAKRLRLDVLLDIAIKACVKSVHYDTLEQQRKALGLAIDPEIVIDIYRKKLKDASIFEYNVKETGIGWTYASIKEYTERSGQPRYVPPTTKDRNVSIDTAVPKYSWQT